MDQPKLGDILLKYPFFRALSGLLLVFLFSFLTACRSENKRFQGYVDGRYTYVSSNVSGRLKKLLVARGDAIEKKQPLFILEAEPENSQLEEAKFAVMQARNQLESAEAGLKLAEITLNRRSILEKKAAIDIQAVDQSRTQRDQAIASRDQAVSNLRSSEAALARSEWYYNEKTIHAAREAFVFDTLYLPGEVVPAGTPVISLLSKKDIYAIFYVRGTVLSHLKINQAVKIFESGRAGSIPAKITFISPSAEYAPPVIYSNETNYKLVFRIEVTPLSPTYDLHPGAPVEIRL